MSKLYIPFFLPVRQVQALIKPSQDIAKALYFLDKVTLLISLTV
jgi:hypothetical protein